MKNKIQLIAYVERCGGDTLTQFDQLLQGDLHGLFGAVHLLPFFHTIHGMDAGFDPIDHLQVDADLGDWADIATIAKHTDVMADVIVNHMSIKSPQFEDFSKHGQASPFAGLFLTEDKVFPQGLSEANKALIYRPRPTSAFTDTRLACGETRRLWTTFTPEQVDIDVQSPQGQEYLQQILATFAQSGIKYLRLDAIGYAIKKAGTNCFMLPETFTLIEALAAQARALGMEVLVEIHSHYQTQIDIASKVDWVYDFALPPLILHALFAGDAAPLQHWLNIRPRNAVTVLDTHDGIGIIDIGTDKLTRLPGLISDAAVDALVEHIHSASQGQSRLATGNSASNLDLYQVNCTYYDALGRDNLRYLMARALQFFVPGVPQVYYVGLLAGENDMALLQTTQVGRDINRHYFSAAEVRQSLQKPVVRKLLELIRLRNQHPAFDGEFQVLPSPAHALSLRWQAAEHFAQLDLNFATTDAHLHYSAAAGTNAFSWQVD